MTGECGRCGNTVPTTKSGYPHAHKYGGRQCIGVEVRAVGGGGHSWCLVCGKRVDIDEGGDIVQHGHCQGNRTAPHPYPPGDDEFTPPSIFEPVLRALGRKEFAFDPCSHPDSKVPAMTKLYYEHDGLSFNWDAEGVGWGQPPYSRPQEWIRRFAAHPGGMVCLLNGDYSTSIWENVIWPKALFVILMHKRIKHESPHRTVVGGAKRPSALVAFDPERAITWVPEGIVELEAMGRVVT